jgi:hypothetical protein
MANEGPSKLRVLAQQRLKFKPERVRFLSTLDPHLLVNGERFFMADRGWQPVLRNGRKTVYIRDQNIFSTESEEPSSSTSLKISS